MAQEPQKQQANVTIRDLYPQLTEEECRKAGETLDRYIELMLRMYERIRSDPEQYAKFKALTAGHRSLHWGPPKVESPHDIKPA